MREREEGRVKSGGDFNTENTENTESTESTESTEKRRRRRFFYLEEGEGE